MPPHRFRTSSTLGRELTEGRHRFEHWYRDNTVYFITARCRDRFTAFATHDAKDVFFDRFDHWTAHFGFVPWVTTLLSNHYHTLGYRKVGENPGPMMQRIHGSVAKLVNDLLPERASRSGKRGTTPKTTSTAASATRSSVPRPTATRSPKAPATA